MSASANQPPEPSGNGWQNGSGWQIATLKDGGWRRWTAVERNTGKEASAPSQILALIILIALLVFSSNKDEPEDLSDEFEQKIKRARAEYNAGDFSSLDDVRNRLND